jgi:hypothetical protein
VYRSGACWCCRPLCGLSLFAAPPFHQQTPVFDCAPQGATETGVKSLEMLLLVGHVDARLDRMDARMDTRIEKWTREVNSSVDQKVDTLAGKQEETRMAVGALAGKQEETRLAVGALEGKVGALEGKVGALEGKMGTLEGKMGTLEGKMGTLAAKMGTIEESVKGLATKQEEMGKTVVRAQAVGSAVVLLGGVLGAVLAQAPLGKKVLGSLLGAA